MGSDPSDEPLKRRHSSSDMLHRLSHDANPANMLSRLSGAPRVGAGAFGPGRTNVGDHATTHPPPLHPTWRCRGQQDALVVRAGQDVLQEGAAAAVTRGGRA